LNSSGVAVAVAMLLLWQLHVAGHRYWQSHSKPLKPDGGIYFLMIFLPALALPLAVHFPAGERSLYSVYFLICVLVKSFSI